jgi:hypothetical protein
VLHICYGNSLLAEPGWEAYLRYCRKGLTGLPMTEVFDIADLKPEGLHAVIKTTQLLSDLGEAMAWCLDKPVDLQAKLRDEYDLYKPQSGAKLHCASI